MAMTCDERERHLSEFVDGELAAPAAAEMAAHLQTCARCAGAARDLTRLRDAARTLGPIDPPARVWNEIARRQPEMAPDTHATPAARRSPGWRRAGIAAAVVLTVGGSAYFGLRAWRTASPAAGVTPMPMIADTLAKELFTYDTAIAALEGAARQGDSAMDPVLAAKLQRNLGVLDQAISDSRTALTRNPESVPARDSLLEALQQKVTVLQQTVAVIGEMRTMDSADAPTSRK